MALMTFEQWMTEVDRHLVGELGLDSNSLPDQLYYDMYEDEIPAVEAAEQVIENLQEDWFSI